MGVTAIPWKSPQEVLGTFVEFIPTFFVPIHCVAAILTEDCRKHFVGRGKFLGFLKRYRFYFDLRILDGVRCDVKLRDEVNHPRRGAADEKFTMTDIGEVAEYVSKPEFIVSLESMEQSGMSVSLKPAAAPPAVHVHLEGRVPVVERLILLIPKDFTPIDLVEEEIPEDILFHPYFDCQGGLTSIASKFPEHFQVVEGSIRQRPPALAPLALNEYTLDASPMPEVAQRIAAQVCASEIPQWISVTSLYEQLSQPEKRQIKKDFKSFASFLRAHGKSLSISQDMLKVAQWIPPRGQSATPGAAAANSSVSLPAPSSGASTPPPSAASPTDSAATSLIEEARVQLINELFDRFPANRALSVPELLLLVPVGLRFAIPKKILPWLQSHSKYFVVEQIEEPGSAGTMTMAKVRRASDRQPLDIALILYQFIPDEGIKVGELMRQLPKSSGDHVRRMGLHNVVNALPEWLALTPSTAADSQLDDATVTRLRTETDIEDAIRNEESKTENLEELEEKRKSKHSAQEADLIARWPVPKYEGNMSHVPLGTSSSKPLPVGTAVPS